MDEASRMTASSMVFGWIFGWGVALLPGTIGDVHQRIAVEGEDFQKPTASQVVFPLVDRNDSTGLGFIEGLARDRDSTGRD